MFVADFADDLRRLDGRCTEDDAVQPAVKQRHGVLGGPDTATELHVHVGSHRVEDGVDGCRVLSLALERAVEVDEMERPRPGVHPSRAPRPGRRRFPRCRVRRRPTGPLSVLHVDRGNDLELGVHDRWSGGSRRKRVGPRRTAAV